MVEEIANPIHQRNDIRSTRYEVYKKKKITIDDQNKILLWCDDGKKISDEHNKKIKECLIELHESLPKDITNQELIFKNLTQLMDWDPKEISKANLY